MNIDKAIEILTAMQKEQVYLLTPDGGDAVLLGIEALKRYECLREDCAFIRGEKLPGETEGVSDEPQ